MERDFVAVYAAQGKREATPEERYVATVNPQEFHDFLIGIGAPLEETIRKCLRLGWIREVRLNLHHLADRSG